MRTQWTTAELKALGVTATFLALLHPAGTRTLGVLALGRDGHRVRSFTNVYAAWSIARDLCRDAPTLAKGRALLAKRGVVLPGLEAEIAKAWAWRHSPLPEDNA